MLSLNFTGEQSKFADLLEKEAGKYVTLVFLEAESATIDELQGALSIAKRLGYTRLSKIGPMSLTYMNTGRIFLER